VIPTTVNKSAKKPSSILRVIYFLLGILALVAIVATRYNQIDVPLFNHFRSPNRVDPATLHLAGEFVENNLGPTQEADGSVTDRMIAQQYLFVPYCTVLPAGVPIHLRITSADVTHTLKIAGTDYSVKIARGVITQAELQFPHAGQYDMPCSEFCGPGHYAMHSKLIVVPKEQFQTAGQQACEAGSKTNGNDKQQ